MADQKPLIISSGQIQRIQSGDVLDLSSAGIKTRDGSSEVQNTADGTKKLAFDASRITTGNTRTLTMGDRDLDLEQLQATGFENRTDSTIGMSGSDFQIQPAVTNYAVWTGGKRHVVSALQSVSIATDKTLHYVYFDTAGALQVSTSAWDIAGNGAPVAIVFRDGSDYAVTDERHSYIRDKVWHKWAHLTIGARYGSGFTGTFDASSLSVTQGTIWDEDIQFDSGGTKTSTTLWYRQAAGAGMRMVRGSATVFAEDGSGYLEYDDGSGTLQPVTNNNYGVGWVYAGNDQAEPIYTVIGQGDYASITAARNAGLPTIALSTAEWKLLYKVIFKRTSGGTVYEEAIDYRSQSTGPATTAITSDHAALINRDAANAHPAEAVSVDASGFTGNLSSADDTVQKALDTLDGVTPGGAGSDTTAIHKATASEISAITEKTNPVGADMLLIEDSADSNNKKRLTVDNLLTTRLGIESRITIANNSTDSSHDIDFSTGWMYDSSGEHLLAMSAMTKRIDAAWAAGTGNGGLFSGTVANNTWYYCFVIRKTSDGSIDCGFDTSITAANIPSGYVAYRRVGAIRTDSSANILAFHQHGIEFWYDLQKAAYSLTNPGTSSVTVTLNEVMPSSEAILNVALTANNAFSTRVYLVVQPTWGTASPSPSLFVLTAIQNNPSRSSCQIRVPVDSSRQIKYQVSFSASTTQVDMMLLGWVDYKLLGAA